MLLSKLKIVGTLFLSLMISTVLITYMFPTKSSTFNKNFFNDIQNDSHQFIANLFDSTVRNQNDKVNKLAEEAKKGVYTSVAQGIEKFENTNGTAYKISVHAMDWEDYKTYTINGKKIRVRVEKGSPSPSQELLEKLAKYY